MAQADSFQLEKENKQHKSTIFQLKSMIEILNARIARLEKELQSERVPKLKTKTDAE